MKLKIYTKKIDENSESNKNPKYIYYYLISIINDKIN